MALLQSPPPPPPPPPFTNTSSCCGRVLRSPRPFRRNAAVRCSADRQSLFNRIAPVYDSLNDVLSLGQHRTWKRTCISWSRAKRGDRALDLCCGGGDLAFLLSQIVGLHGQVSALDFSREPLSIASTRQDLLGKPCYSHIECFS